MFLKYTLTLARYLTTSLKFEPIIGSSIEIGKEVFVDFLKEIIKEFYQEIFYYMKDTTDLPFELFENALYSDLKLLCLNCLKDLLEMQVISKHLIKWKSMRLYYQDFYLDQFS